MAQMKGLREILLRKEKQDNDEFREVKISYITQFDILEQFLAFDSCTQDNLAEEVFKEKIRFHKTALAQILGLIVEREKVRQLNIGSLDSEIMDFQSQLYFYKCHTYPISPDNKRKSNLDRTISELKNRRQQEKANFWKDTVKMWQQLLDIAAEYRAAVRKAKILLPDN